MTRTATSRQALDVDRRMDPRVAAMFGSFDKKTGPVEDVENRAQALAYLRATKGGDDGAQAFFGKHLESLTGSDALAAQSHEFTSRPDGNTGRICLIRPADAAEPLPCVYYIHGGGMATGSCYDALYQIWGRTIAGFGVAVAMVDFRNCGLPSSLPEVAPYPAGLDDCASGLAWLQGRAGSLGLDESRIVVAGESGGGNLTLALGLRLRREGALQGVAGLYALCPFIAGLWPYPESVSSTENNLVGGMDLHNNHSAMLYGVEQLQARNPLAWPRFAKTDDVRDFPPTMISVNELDPLRDEGVNFYRLLLQAGAPAQCRQVMGTPHAADCLPSLFPDIARETAASIARFCASPPAR